MTDALSITENDKTEYERFNDNRGMTDFTSNSIVTVKIRPASFILRLILRLSKRDHSKERQNTAQYRHSITYVQSNQVRLYICSRTKYNSKPLPKSFSLVLLTEGKSCRLIDFSSIYRTTLTNSTWHYNNNDKIELRAAAPLSDLNNYYYKE